MQSQETNLDWFETHYRELKAQYSGRWILIASAHVIGHFESYETGRHYALKEGLEGFSLVPMIPEAWEELENVRGHGTKYDGALPFY